MTSPFLTGSIPDLSELLVSMRTTLDRLINDSIAGVDPSPSDWLTLTDDFCGAHLLWRRQCVLADKVDQAMEPR